MKNFDDPNSDGMKKALAWEAEYLKFVQNFMKTEAKAKGMTIAYSSEVS